MVQEQLVDYISGQLKLGVSREAVKTALVGVGWMAGDIEETLKKVEGGARAAPVSATPVSAAVAVASPMVASPVSVRPVGSAAVSTGAGSGASNIGASTGVSSMGAGAVTGNGAKLSPFTGGPTEQKSIKVSDLISGSAASGAAVRPAPSGPLNAAKDVAKNAGPTVLNMKATEMSAGGGSVSHAGLVIKIAMGVIIVALAALAGYFYFQNTGLASKVASLGGDTAAVTSQISGLQAQVQALNASNTALVAHADSLTKENADLKNNLSFVGAPATAGGAAASGTLAEETVSVSGLITQKKASYVLTTSYGVMVYVKNTTSTAVVAALTPLVGSSTTVQLSGTHVPGSQYLTVTAVNGTALQ